MMMTTFPQASRRYLKKTLLSLGVVCLGLHSEASAQSPANVLTLPEIIVTSFRGTLGIGKTNTSSTSQKIQPPAPGQPPQPVTMPPGTRIDVSYSDDSNHAIVSFPGLGGCMISNGSSLRLPDTQETDMTVTFDRHIGGTPNRLFLNLNAAEMAKQGDKVFRTKTKYRGNSDPKYVQPNVVFSTRGGRFFILDSQSKKLPEEYKYEACCTIGVLDGTATVEELLSGQKVELQAGQVVVVTAKEITPPRAPTKAELSYDLCCKLAVLGRPAPSQVPASLRPKLPPTPGGKANSLGMIMAPLPGTEVMMCIHETRQRDFADYQTTIPATPDESQVHGTSHGIWGWEDYPVMASWDDAQAFCDWLSQKEGKKYRLPTDEEWSIAVGIAGKEKRKPDETVSDLVKNQRSSSAKSPEGYPWGTNWPPRPGSGNLPDASFYADYLSREPGELKDYDDGYAETAPVMSFTPNKLGFYDLAGNVSEWCADWYDDTRQRRVYRGSDYRGSDNYLDTVSARRYSAPPNLRGATGFRVVMDLR